LRVTVPELSSNERAKKPEFSCFNQVGDAHTKLIKKLEANDVTN